MNQKVWVLIDRENFDVPTVVCVCDTKEKIREAFALWLYGNVRWCSRQEENAYGLPEDFFTALESKKYRYNEEEEDAAWIEELELNSLDKMKYGFFSAKPDFPFEKLDKQR